MIIIKENGMVDARDLHNFLEVKSPFHKFVELSIYNADLEEGKDFRN